MYPDAGDATLFVLQAHDYVRAAVDYHGSIFLGSRQVEFWGESTSTRGRRGDPCAQAGKAKQGKARGGNVSKVETSDTS